MPDEEFDEHECLSRVHQGDEGAARAFLHHFYPFVLKLVRAHLPRRLNEEDLVQMIFIKVFQNLDKYGGKVPLEHWISRIAVNTCLNALRAEKSRPEWRVADFSEEAATQIEQLARAESYDEIDSSEDVAQAKQILSEMLAQLSPADRLLITLLHLEERSIDEIHQLTGWSRTAIKVRAFRARCRMKKMLPKSEAFAFAIA